METIQVVIDTKLRKAAEQAAKRKKLNRSAYIRHAVREQVKRDSIQEKEERERRAYKAMPDTADDWEIWEREIAWPEE